MYRVRQSSEGIDSVLAIEECHGYVYLQVHQTHPHHKLEPKEDAEEEKKGVFRDSYSKVNQDKESHDVLFVIEDLNTHGRNDSEFRDKIMGRTSVVT